MRKRASDWLGQITVLLFAGTTMLERNGKLAVLVLNIDSFRASRCTSRSSATSCRRWASMCSYQACPFRSAWPTSRLRLTYLVLSNSSHSANRYCDRFCFCFCLSSSLGPINTRLEISNPSLR
jgi:hypothetical protein